MPIQSHAPVTVGTAGVKNVMGAWHLLIPEVEADSIWCLVQASIVSDAFDTITLELGVGLTGEEVFDIPDLNDQLQADATLRVTASSADGGITRFEIRVRIDTPVEMEYFRHGGILQAVLRKLLDEES